MNEETNKGGKRISADRKPWSAFKYNIGITVVTVVMGYLKDT